MPSGGMLPDLAIQGVSVLSGVPNGHGDLVYGGGMFSESSAKGLGRPGSGYHSGRLVGGPQKQGSGPMFSDAQGVQGGNEHLWGPVMEVSQPGECGGHEQVALTAAPKHDEAGANALYIGGDQPGVNQSVLMDLGNRQPVLVLPNSPQRSQHGQPNAGGETSTPSGAFGSSFSTGAASGQGVGDHQIPSGDGQEHNPLPQDSQILKIIPCSLGVFGVLYVRPGHSGMGAAVWDGRAIHDMGMFSTKIDAERACKSGTDLIVRFHFGTMNAPLSSGSEGACILASLAQNENQLQAQQGQMLQGRLLSSAARQAPAKGHVDLVNSNLGASNERDGQVSGNGGGGNLERPACVPGFNSSQQNLLRLLSIGSEDLNKYICQMPTAGHDDSLAGVVPEHNRSVTAIAEMIKQDNGNLGSLLHWDSWNSSILGLLSKSHSPSPGAALDNTKRSEDKEHTPFSREIGAAVDAESSQPAGGAGVEPMTLNATAVPSWLKDLGSLAELGSIAFQEGANLSCVVRPNDDCFLLQQQGSGFGSEVGEAGASAAATAGSAAKSSLSVLPRSTSVEKHKADNPLSSMYRHNLSSDYDEVIDWFVSRPQGGENRKSTADGLHIKSEEGAAAGRDGRQYANQAPQPVARSTSQGSEGPPGVRKRKGLEGCEDLITTKRPRLP
eukprot:evm.model.scf_33.6 EVM.evm.TU.scf_33.6   scf_33:88200-90748(+)